MKSGGLIDGIIREPLGGAHNDPAASFATVKEVILQELDALRKVHPDQLVQSRIDKFCAMGVVVNT